MKNYFIILLFYCFIFFPTLCMGGGYIESIVSDSAVSKATADVTGNYSILYSHGSGGYTYNIFYSACNINNKIPYAYSYVSLPLKIRVGNDTVDVNWHSSSPYIVDGERIVFYSRRSEEAGPGECKPVGNSNHRPIGAPLVIDGSLNILKLLSPGIIKLDNITYYVGNVFGDSEAEALSILRQYNDKGTPTILIPNGDGTLIIPYQCRLSNGSDSINIPMGEVLLGTQKSRVANYTISCNAEYAALKVMDFKLYGVEGQEISSSVNRQMIKIKLDNGSIGEIDITPQLSGVNVELLMNVTLDASLGKEGSAEGSAVLRYTFD